MNLNCLGWGSLPDPINYILRVSLKITVPMIIIMPKMGNWNTQPCDQESRMETIIIEMHRNASNPPPAGFPHQKYPGLSEFVPKQEASCCLP